MKVGLRYARVAIMHEMTPNPQSLQGESSILRRRQPVLRSVVAVRERWARSGV